MTNFFPREFPGTEMGSVVVDGDGYTAYTVVSRDRFDTTRLAPYFFTTAIVRDGAATYGGTVPCTLAFAESLLGL